MSLPKPGSWKWTTLPAAGKSSLQKKEKRRGLVCTRFRYQPPPSSPRRRTLGFSTIKANLRLRFGGGFGQASRAFSQAGLPAGVASNVDGVLFHTQFDVIAVDRPNVRPRLSAGPPQKKLAS